MGIGMQSVIKRLPIMIAPFLGGVLIDRFGMITGVRIGLLVSIVVSSATIGVQRHPARGTAGRGENIRSAGLSGAA